MSESNSGASPQKPDELLPCPFCGGEATAENQNVITARVICIRCGVSTDWYRAYEAIAAWNRREPQGVQEVGEPGGIARIAAERRRQVEREGWTSEHDDTHTDGALAVCASIYATPPNQRENDEQSVPWGWPFNCCDWKPGDRIRELEKAGALIAAEIDRLLRACGESAAPSAKRLGVLYQQIADDIVNEIYLPAVARAGIPFPGERIVEILRCRALSRTTGGEG